MDIKTIELKNLIPYDKNPRKNDEAVKYVAASIREFGFKVPIVIDRNNVIVAGHTRYKAAQELGLKDVPCIIADDLTDEQIKAFRLADNKTGEFAEWDFNILGFEIGNIIDLDMADFGFEEIAYENFSDDFSLPDGEKSEFVKMTLMLHENQKAFIDEINEKIELSGDYFQNTNKNGNKVFEVYKQWAELKK